MKTFVFTETVVYKMEVDDAISKEEAEDMFHNLEEREIYFDHVENFNSEEAE